MGDLLSRRAPLLAALLCLALPAAAQAQNRVNFGSKSMELPYGWAGAPNGDRAVTLQRAGGKKIVMYARALPSFLQCSVGLPDTKIGGKVRRRVAYLGSSYEQTAVETPTLSGGLEAIVCSDLPQGVLVVQIIWKASQQPYDASEVALVLETLREGGASVSLPSEDTIELPGLGQSIRVNSEQGAWSVAKQDERWVVRRDWPTSTALSVRVVRARHMTSCARPPDPTMKLARANQLVPDGWYDYAYETLLTSPSTGQAYGWIGRLCKEMGSGVLIAQVDNIGSGVGRPAGRDATELRYVLEQTGNAMSSSFPSRRGSGGGGGGGGGDYSIRKKKSGILGVLPRMRYTAGVTQLKPTFKATTTPPIISPPDPTLGGSLSLEWDKWNYGKGTDQQLGVGYFLGGSFGYDPKSKFIVDIKAEWQLLFPPYALMGAKGSSPKFNLFLMPVIGVGWDGIGVATDADVGGIGLDDNFYWDYGVRLQYRLTPRLKLEVAYVKASRFSDSIDECLRMWARAQYIGDKGTEWSLGVFKTDYYGFAESLTGGLGVTW